MVLTYAQEGLAIDRPCLGCMSNVSDQNDSIGDKLAAKVKRRGLETMRPVWNEFAFEKTLGYRTSRPYRVVSFLLHTPRNLLIPPPQPLRRSLHLNS